MGVKKTRDWLGWPERTAVVLGFAHQKRSHTRVSFSISGEERIKTQVGIMDTGNPRRASGPRWSGLLPGLIYQQWGDGAAGEVYIGGPAPISYPKHAPLAN